MLSTGRAIKEVLSTASSFQTLTIRSEASAEQRVSHSPQLGRTIVQLLAECSSEVALRTEPMSGLKLEDLR